MDTKPGISGKDESEIGFAQSTGQNFMGRFGLENKDENNSGNTFEEQVFEALKRSPKIDASHIRVRVQGHVVTLDGTEI